MRFMVIVPASKESEAGVLPDAKLLADMGKFNEEMIKAGVMLAGEGLQPTSKGARLKFQDGKTTVTDGPFTESKELIAGFWLLQVKSKDEAIAWMRRAPFGGGTELENPTGLRSRGFRARPAARDAGVRGADAREGRLQEGAMRYVCLVYMEPQNLTAVPDRECAACGASLRAAGQLVAAEALQPAATARTLRVRDGRPVLIDGPFTETKEQLAGFYLIDAKDFEEALAIAAKIPPARAGSIEVRPVRELYVD